MANLGKYTTKDDPEKIKLSDFEYAVLEALTSLEQAIRKER